MYDENDSDELELENHKFDEDLALGNNLRKRFSNKYLAEKCIERIAVDRHTPPDGVGKGYETVGEGVDAKYSPSIAGVST